MLLLTIFEIRDWTSYLVSESYALSLVILLIALPLVIELADRRAEMRGGVAAMRFVALAVAAFAIVLSKSSVGVLFAGGLIFAAIRARLRPLAFVSVFILGAAAIALSAVVTATPAYAGDPLIGPWHFFTTYPDAAYPNMWAIVVGMAAGAWGWGTATPERRLQFESLGAIAAAALACGMVFRGGAGSAYYFMNVGAWVAIALAGGAFMLPRLDRIGRRAVVVTVLIAGIAIATLANADKRHGSTKLIALATAVDAEAAHQAADGHVRSASTPTFAAFLSPDDSLRHHIAESAGISAGGRLRERLAADPDADIVYVPPANTAFWGMSKTLCTAPPFFVPAVAARPLLHGLPPSPDACPLPLDTGYGYFNYGDSSRSSVLSDSEVCAAAQRLGFRTALVLESPDRSRVVTCR